MVMAPPLTAPSASLAASTSSPSSSSLQLQNRVFSPIYRLPNELLSEIIYAGLDEPWTRAREQYLARLSATSSLWRSLVIGDPRLWTYISLSDERISAESGESEPRSFDEEDEERVRTLIARSGQDLPLQIRVDLAEGTVTASLKACLKMLQKELHRCESIRLTTSSIVGWEIAFPIRTKGGMPMLKDVEVTSRVRDASEVYFAASHEPTPVRLFECADGEEDACPVPNLEKLSIQMEHPHILDLSNINPLSLKSLRLCAYLPHPDAFHFINQCNNLEFLELELPQDDETAELGAEEDDADLPAPELPQAPALEPEVAATAAATARMLQKEEEQARLEGVHMPSLTSLSVVGPSAMELSSIIDAPQLSSLRFTLSDDVQIPAFAAALLTSSEKRLWPTLKSLQTVGEYYLPAPSEPIAEFIRTHPALEVFETSNFLSVPQTIEELTEHASEVVTLSRSSSSASLSSLPLSRVSSSTSISSRLSSFTPRSPPKSVLSHLKTIRVIEGEDEMFPSRELVQSHVDELATFLPNLEVEWVSSC